MDGNDIVFQRAVPSEKDSHLCPGFFACWANEKTLKLWEDIEKAMIADPRSDDQGHLNQLQGKGLIKLKYTRFPETFFNPGIIEKKTWNPGDKFKWFPSNIVLHHACWTKGIPNKIEQFEYVKRLVGEKEELNTKNN